jgi:peroxiredoxin
MAPDFSVNDSEGRRIRLSDYKGKKNVMLVFNRGFQ